MIYMMQAKTYTCGADVLAAGKAVRARLLATKRVINPVTVRHKSYAPAPLPVLPVYEWSKGDLAPPPLWKQIVIEVAARHGVSYSAIIGPSRTKPVSAARQEAIYLISRRTELSLPDIGRRIGNRDHTTVLHSLKAHAARVGITGPLKRDVIELSKESRATKAKDWPQVVETIALRDGLTVAQICGDQRRADILAARHEAYCILYTELGMNYSEIGRAINGREHSGVRRAILNAMAAQVAA